MERKEIRVRVRVRDIQVISLYWYDDPPLVLAFIAPKVLIITLVTYLRDS